MKRFGLVLLMLVFVNILWCQGLLLEKSSDGFGLSLEGKQVGIYDYAVEIENGGYMVKRDYKWGMVDVSGATTISLEYDKLVDGSGYVMAYRDGLAGIFDYNGTVLVELKYQDVKDYSDDRRAKVKSNGKWMIWDDGELLPNEPDVIYRIVDQMPRFPGCEENEDMDNHEKKACADKKMLEFIYTYLRYPEKDSEDKNEGTVVLSFVVEKDGSMSDVRVMRTVTPSLGAESERVVKSMPQNWTPGIYKGEPVRVQFTLPVKFKL